MLYIVSKKPIVHLCPAARPVWTTARRLRETSTYVPRDRLCAMRRIALGLAGILLVSVAAFLYGSLFAERNTLALDAIDACFLGSRAPTSTAACLERTVDRLLVSYSTADLMRYVNATTTSQDVVLRCHPIGHIVGEQTYYKFKDVESTLSACTSDCRSACTHGAIGAAVLDEMGETYPDDEIAHASEDELKRLGRRYCDAGGTLCHAIGHVAYIASEDDAASIDICAAVSEGSLREGCYQGVFMERSGTFLNALFPSAEERPADIRPGKYTYPCTSVPPDARHACFLFLGAYQYPLFQADNITSADARLSKSVATCASLSGRDRASCFEGIGTMRALFGFQSLESSEIHALCRNMPTEEDKSACVLGIVPQFHYVNRRGIFDYCDAIDTDEVQSVCYNAAFQYIEESLGKSDADAICKSHTECRARYEAFLQKRPAMPDYRFGLFGK